MNILWQKWQAQLPSIFELLFVLCLAWLVSGWWSGSSTTSYQVESNHIDDLSTSIFNVEKVIAGKLFGALQHGEAENETTVSKPVVVSKLNIRLLGTVVAGDRSAAVVSLNGASKQQVFFIGERLQAGVELDAVEVDAIVVLHQGKHERIVLNKDAPLQSVGLKSPISAPPVRALGGMHRQMNRRYLNKQVRNFPKLLSQARVVPHFNQGKSDGFEIKEIVPGSLYEKVGLQNGDVIRKVNGQEVKSAEQAMAMYQALQNATAIDLEIGRAGTIVPIHYDIQ